MTFYFQRLMPYKALSSSLCPQSSSAPALNSKNTWCRPVELPDAETNTSAEEAVANAKLAEQQGDWYAAVAHQGGREERWTRSLWSGRNRDLTKIFGSTIPQC